VRHFVGVWSAFWELLRLCAVLTVPLGAVLALADLTAFCNLVVITRVASIFGFDVLWVVVVPDVLLVCGAAVLAASRELRADLI
jgi:hypothetical protein